ncbi:MAG: ATP-binding protein, partial [Dehalococcoidia bacterium]|nr:ATP-binding protein [Dehalococcoidia bacterium]
MTPSPASDPFVGRARELAVLTEALETAIGGHGGIVTVSGEAGIGKTRLAEKLSQQAEARDAETLWGRCHEEGGAPSYWPWVRAVRSHVLATTEDRLHKELGTSAALLGTVLPEITTRFKGAKYQPVAEESAEQTRFRLFDAFTTFLGNAASNRPIVLFLDDL